MMELRLYGSILRANWPIVLAVPLLAALISLAAALARPPAYGLTAEVLATRAPDARGTGGPAGVDTDDTVAYDLPAIIESEPFANEIARDMLDHGHSLGPSDIMAALRASNQRHVVRISVTTARPEAAPLIAETTIRLIKTNGLRYWGDPKATPDQPGVLVQILHLPTEATRINGLPAITAEVALRAIVGLIAGIGLAFGRHYLNRTTEVVREGAGQGGRSSP